MSTRISDIDLAQLALMDRTSLADRQDQLPPADVVHHGACRPQRVRDLDAVLAWAHERTAGMSDERCRLFTALRVKP